MKIHYALQTCDVGSYQGQPRFCSDNRTEISKKCVKSFLLSVKYCSDHEPASMHHIAIIDDHSTAELKEFLYKCKDEFTSSKIKIEIIELKTKTGIRKSIEECYLWLKRNGEGLVYQVQDDYLFTESAVYESINMFNQVLAETDHQSIISPFNDVYTWLTQYRNRSTPRAIMVGRHRYWIQYYDMSCSFITSYKQFVKHWDLYETFFELIDQYKENEKKGLDILENRSLNYMLTQRGILGLVPISSLAFHMQTENNKDPHIDWKPIWDNIKID